MLSRTLAAQYQVISRQQTLKCGLRRSTVTTWCKPNQRWQKLLPGVYLAVTGTPTPEQRLVAAMLYAGKHCVITGNAALRLHRLRGRGPDIVDVLIPWTDRRQSAGFVRVHRTRRMPARRYRIGVILFAAPAPRRSRRRGPACSRRWTMCRRWSPMPFSVVPARSPRSALNWRKAEAGYVSASQGAGRGSGRTRSVAIHFRERIGKSGLPAQRFNVFLKTSDGVDIGEVDAWWGDAGVSVEIDSQNPLPCGLAAH